MRSWELLDFLWYFLHYCTLHWVTDTCCLHCNKTMQKNRLFLSMNSIPLCNSCFPFLSNWWHKRLMLAECNLKLCLDCSFMWSAYSWINTLFGKRQQSCLVISFSLTWPFFVAWLYFPFTELKHSLHVAKLPSNYAVVIQVMTCDWCLWISSCFF